ncbi:MAG: cyclic nucleotide-binding domain-containing protein [Thermoanaerobaculia bacterium]|nr:cyclic nucleotide-binding domain-containing protein [Thermoanaerobaculia bacterium]
MKRLSRIEMVMHLQAVDVFSYCSAEQVVRLAEIGRQRDLSAGEVLYRRGDPPDVMYCIFDGGMELESDDGNRSLTAPSTFGVREILSDRRRSEDARARQRTILLAFDAEDLFDLLSNNIEIVKALFRRLLTEDDT